MVASPSAAAPGSPYVRAWWIVVSIITVTGSLLAVVTVGATVVGMAVTAGLVTACTSLLMRAEDGATHRRRFRTLVRDSATGSVAVCAVVGWVGLAGPGVLVLFLATALTSPRAVRMINARLGHARPRVMIAPALESIDTGTRSSALLDLAPRGITSATTPQIVAAWNASGAELRRRRAAGGACLHLVRLRQACLDELERRDPAGLQCWLASGPSVGGDPTRYFGPDLPASGAA